MQQDKSKLSLIERCFSIAMGLFATYLIICIIEYPQDFVNAFLGR